MSDTKSYVDVLQSIRNSLVDERRGLAQECYDLLQRDINVKKEVLGILELQRAIREIDSIMAEEQALEPSVYETHGIREI